MKLISVFEHQRLTVGTDGFSEDHRDALERFLGDSDEEKFPYYTLIHRGVKFRHYVGAICVGDLTIEVLPKTDNDGDDDECRWQQCLVNMLSKVYKLDVKAPTDVAQTLQRSPILDIFINKFLNEVDRLLNRGLVKCYHRVDGNSKALKGKLLIGKQVTKNFVHKERFYVRQTTYDHEHSLNCILRQALTIIPKVTNNLMLRGRANTLLFNFPELHEIAVTPELFSRLEFDRKTEDYREAVKIAQLLLLHFRPSNSSGRYDIMALMFDMNKLWEEYVYLELRRNAPLEYDVKAQQKEYLWISDSRSVSIKPDIFIIREKGTFILDTKWKRPRDNRPSDGDMHQMYAYLKLFNAEKVALIYPATDTTETINGHFIDGDKNCDLVFLSLFDKASAENHLLESSKIVQPIWEWVKTPALHSSAH